MTKFVKEMFDTAGEYMTYGPDRKFVARFKHKGPFTKAKLIKALVKFYDTETYFARVAKEAPFGILMNDGYVTFDAVNRKINFNY